MKLNLIIISTSPVFTFLFLKTSLHFTLTTIMTPSTSYQVPGSQLRSPKHPATAPDDHENHHHHHSLLSGIPDHIAQFCLSHLPPSLLFSVCRSWRRLLYSPSFPPFLSIYAVIVPSHLPNTLHLSSFDPISRNWLPLPPPPLRFLFRHPSFISRNLPIQTVTAAGKLVVVAATNHKFLPALSKPLIFNPASTNWSFGPELSFPRRWCAAGASDGALYAVSGISAKYNTDVARSVEKLDLTDFDDPTPIRRRWEAMRNLKDGKFCREPIDAVGWRGKLCMVNVKGDTAKEGIIYDVAADSWGNMPEGMLAGWRGPAAAMDEETIYVVNESSGSLKKYDDVRDTWLEVMENDMLKGALHVAAARGKVCVVCGDGVRIAVVEAAGSGRIWAVDIPDRSQVVAVHILPRLSRSGF